ncbi:MAG: acyltransferase [Actinomycetota bacterium]
MEHLAETMTVPRVGVSPGRDIGVDALRGLAILLVVLGHALSAAQNLLVTPATDPRFYLHNFLYTFHMPLFMFVGGYVLYGRRFRVRDRAIRLLVPFFAWIPIYFLVNRYILHWPAQFLHTLKQTILEPGFGLWFLPTLFLCSLLLIPVRHIEKKGRWLGIAYLGVVFVAVNLLPWEELGLMQVKYFFLFFALGYLAARYRPALDRLDRKRVNAALLGTGALFLMLFSLLQYTGRSAPYTFPFSLYDLFETPAVYLTRYAMAVLGIVFAIGLVRLMGTGTVRRAFAWLGLVTMDIYVSHGLFVELTLGAGWIAVSISFLSGIFLPLALSLLVLRQFSATALVFLGIRPGSRVPGNSARGGA